MRLERGALPRGKRTSAPRWQLAKAQRPETRSGQREHGMAQGFKHPANLPIAPFVKGHVDNATIAACGHDAHFCTGRAKVVEEDSAIQSSDVVRGETAADRRTICLFDSETWVKEAMRELSVVGQQQHTTGRIVEPPDGKDARSLRDELGNRRAPLRISHRRNDATGLVQ